MNITDLLVTGALQLDIELSSHQVEQFMQYKEMLVEWNKKINLTAIENDEDIIIKHFIDSITCLSSRCFQENSLVIDVGTGAGFPGIPIKIVRPDLNITLLDSLNKRVVYLEHVIEQLGLKNITAIQGRAEDYGKKEQFREQFDIVVSRAVANLSVLSEYCLPFVKIGGYFIGFKGPDVQQELTQAEKAVNLLGGEVENVSRIKLPFIDVYHSLIFIKKARQCPTKYPRRAGKPAKEPIK